MCIRERDNVVTRIKPVGFDGISIDSYIDSPLIYKYSSVKTKEIKYDDVKLKSDNNPDDGYDTLKEAQDELIRRAKLEFAENHIDELKASYRINFIYLEQTEEYKEYIQAERVYIGDTVSVYEEKHNININVRVIRRKYDVLRQRVLEIELSNTDISKKSITTSDILSELQSIISNSNNNNLQDVIQSMINAGVNDSYVIPVSYTHLDVYKRQEYMDSGAVQISQELEFIVRYFSKLKDISLNTQLYRIIYDGIKYDIQDLSLIHI